MRITLAVVDGRFCFMMQELLLPYIYFKSNRHADMAGLREYDKKKTRRQHSVTSPRKWAILLQILLYGFVAYILLPARAAHEKLSTAVYHCSSMQAATHILAVRIPQNRAGQAITAGRQPFASPLPDK